MASAEIYCRTASYITTAINSVDLFCLFPSWVKYTFQACFDISKGQNIYIYIYCFIWSLTKEK